MNNEIKVSLTILLPGSEMISRQECLKTIQKEVTKKNFKTGKLYKKTIDVTVEDWDKCDKHQLKVSGKKGEEAEIITFFTRKMKPATQTINLNKDAYNYMTSNECPEWHKRSLWMQLSKRQKLEEHLKRIAKNFNGTIKTYQVFED